MYSHVSDVMREELKAKLQRRWENSLEERLQFSSASPVPMLNGLLEGFRKKGRAAVHLVSA